MKNIEINKVEKLIFELLQNVADEQSVTLRVAGGWVRDKLLSENSDDIDIAVEGMSGEAFAVAVNNWMSQHGMDTSSVGVIEANPDKSKHLETATTFIYGLSIDFAGLRTENYTDSSRIPTIGTGTPLEDAQRRDLTINSLFYNLSTCEVEDLLGTGLQDLENKIIRTPLEPEKTFNDDPLRILRAIRFLVRWEGFSIAPELVQAVQKPEMSQALKDKVSKERIGIEFKKMMGSERPHQALELMQKMGIRDVVLELPSDLTGWDMEQNNPYHEMNVWDHTVKVVRTLANNSPVFPPDVRLALTMAAVFHDTGKLDPHIRGEKERGGVMTTTFYDHESESGKIAKSMMQNLKYANSLISATCGFIRPAGLAEGLVRNLIDGQKPTRRSLGKLVRAEAEHLGSYYGAAIYLGQADMTSKKLGTEPETKYFEHFLSIQSRIEKMDVGNAHSMKPILNGHEIMKTLNVAPGPILGKAASGLIDWQLDFPEGTKDEAKQWLLDNHSANTS